MHVESLPKQLHPKEIPAPNTAGTRETTAFLSPSTAVESGGIRDYVYPSTGMVHAQVPWSFHSLHDSSFPAPLQGDNAPSRELSWKDVDLSSLS